MYSAKFLPVLILGGLLACHKPTDVVSPGGLSVPGDSLTATPTAIGQPIGAPTTKTIGPAGGMLTTNDGKIALIFPAGAVKQETAITVQPGENKAPNGVGEAFTISPNISVEQGITVVYYYQDDEMDGAAVDALGIACQDGRQAWQLNHVAKVDKAKKTVTTKIRKGNWWALITEYLLTPEKATVLVGDSREMKLMRYPDNQHFPDWSGGDDADLVVPLVSPVVANNDVAKLYINGVDWTTSTPKDQSWGGVGYNPLTSQILYVAPSRKPANNRALITVEIKNPGSNAKLMLSSEITIVGENSLIINGHSFDNVTVNGSLVNGHLIATAVGFDSTGKSGQLSLLLNSLSVGAHPFTDGIDDTEATSVNVLDAAGKGDNIGGSSSYSTCLVAKAESGAIQVVKADRANGTVKIIIQISGRVVTKHSYKAETCTVTEHKTMPVSARLTILVRE